MIVDDWFEMDVPSPVELARPGAFLWRIDGAPSYVGKATSLGSRLREYRNDVREIVEERPYRKGKPDGFRRVHRALAEARAAGDRVVFSVIEQCERGEHLLLRERHWIGELRPPLDGPSRPPRVGRA